MAGNHRHNGPRPPVRISRNRVWQKEWEPMPWDNKRRTPYFETVSMDIRDWDEVRMRRKRDGLARRYREYQVYYYGTPEQQCTKQFDTRRELIDQFSQITPPHIEFAQSREGRSAISADRRDKEQDEEERKKRNIFMMGFRDHNKQTFEQHLEEKRIAKETQKEVEQKQLQLNPINWSHSLW